MKIAERNDLVEANMRLVYYTYAELYKNSFVVNCKDDLISEGFLGLIKAANSYKGKTKFSTYASTCIRNSMLMYIRSNKKHEDNTISLNAILDSEDDKATEVIDFISDGLDYEGLVVANIDLRDFLKKCDSLSKKIVKLKSYGMTNTDIGKELKYTQGHISRKLIGLRERYKNLNGLQDSQLSSQNIRLYGKELTK